MVVWFDMEGRERGGRECSSGFIALRVQTPSRDSVPEESAKRREMGAVHAASDVFKANLRE